VKPRLGSDEEEKKDECDLDEQLLDSEIGHKMKKHTALSVKDNYLQKKL